MRVRNERVRMGMDRRDLDRRHCPHAILAWSKSGIRLRIWLWCTQLWNAGLLRHCQLRYRLQWQGEVTSNLWEYCSLDTFICNRLWLFWRSWRIDSGSESRHVTHWSKYLLKLPMTSYSNIEIHQQRTIWQSRHVSKRRRSSWWGHIWSAVD